MYNDDQSTNMQNQQSAIEAVRPTFDPLVNQNPIQVPLGGILNLSDDDLGLFYQYEAAICEALQAEKYKDATVIPTYIIENYNPETGAFEIDEEQSEYELNYELLWKRHAEACKEDE